MNALIEKTKKRFGKKGQLLDNITGIFIGVAILGITSVVVLLMIKGLRDNTAGTQLANGSIYSASMGFNISDKMTNVVGSTIDWAPLIVLVIIGSFLLGLIYYFSRTSKQ